jgi:N6-adenosine-specific RNA methylase IME4
MSAAAQQRPKPLAFHPYASIFPLIEGDDLKALVADIAANGLIDPIVCLDDQILDGRNRYTACIEAGVSIRRTEYTGSDPLGFVLSTNLHRRHLNESQRAMVGAKLASMQQGARTDLAQICAMSQEQAADMVHVARRSVQHAKVVREKATPALAKRVELGKVSVSLAAKVAALPKHVQAALSNASESELRGVVKKDRRARREVELGTKTAAASKTLGSKVYGVIYADPPWRFEPYSRDTGMDRAADNHYPTMALDALCAMQVPAADDCVLFLWATVPMLPEALELMMAWKFEYRTHFVWLKDKAGTGYWNRNQHELLLVGVRGKVPAPAPGEQYSSVIEAKVGAHSAKPNAFAEIIDDMFPNTSGVELFARGPRAGWDSWGNEAP